MLEQNQKMQNLRMITCVALERQSVWSGVGLNVFEICYFFLQSVNVCFKCVCNANGYALKSKNEFNKMHKS